MELLGAVFLGILVMAALGAHLLFEDPKWRPWILKGFFLGVLFGGALVIIIWSMVETFVH